MIVPLELEHAHAWVSLFENFFADFPWVPLMDEKQVQDLLTKTEGTESWVAIEDGQVVAIGTLKADNEQSMGVVQNFAFRPRHENAALGLLKHLTLRIKMKNLEVVVLWTWKNMVPMLALMNQAGFQAREQVSLMHAIPANRTTLKERLIFRIKSLADGLSIDDFVESNRLAFAEDNSRLLETDELEYSIESLPGCPANLQLAALENDRILGTVMSEYEEVLSGESRFRRAWVYGLGVIPDARRRGVATCLISELSYRLHAYGVRDIWLLTDFDGPARNFYESVGFHRRTVGIEFMSELKLL